MFKVVIGYPSYHEEVTIVERMSGELPQTTSIISSSELHGLQAAADGIYVDPKIREYAVSLAAATRQPGEFGLDRLTRFIAYGASPRASLNMVLGARALALLRGREYVMAEDVRDLAAEVLRHRIILSYEALAENVSADGIVEAALGAVPAPRIALGDPYQAQQIAPVAGETTGAG
jgi:MoxR-like ATPase